MWRMLASAAVVVAAAGCSGGDESTPAGEGRILVLDGGADGTTLASYRPDGTVETTFVEGADAVVWQPIWSTDGSRVAWTASGDGAEWELVTAAADGGERTSHPLPGRPDYITYGPTDSVVVTLTPSPRGFGLVIVDVANGEAEFDVVDVGQPYFFDFSPDGRRVIAHVGTDVGTVELTGGVDDERSSLGVDSTNHQTPAWHPDADTVVYGAGGATGTLVRRDLDDESPVELAAIGPLVLFDLDPDGERLVVSSFGSDGDLQAFRGRSSGEAPAQREPSPLGTGLWLVDVEDGSAERLADRPTAAPLWDPTGERVLVRASLDRTASWDVYDLDGERTGTEPFDIRGSLMQLYLPFWDQYIRSQTVWSPDGERFVHVGADEEGRRGVWVHEAGSTGPSTFLADGDLAFWSPR